MKKVLVAGAALMLAGSMVSAASAEVNLSGDARVRYIGASDYARAYTLNPNGTLNEDKNGYADEFDSRIRVKFDATAKGGAFMKARIRFDDFSFWDGQGWDAYQDDKNIWTDYAYIGVPMGPVVVTGGRMQADFTKFFSWDGRPTRLKADWKSGALRIIGLYDIKSEVAPDARDNWDDNDITAWGLIGSYQINDDWMVKGYARYQDNQRDYNALGLPIGDGDSSGFLGSIHTNGKVAMVGLEAEVAYKSSDVQQQYNANGQFINDDGWGGYVEASLDMGAFTPALQLGFTQDGYEADPDFGFIMIGADEPITLIPTLGTYGGDSYWAALTSGYQVSEQFRLAGNLVYYDIDLNDAVLANADDIRGVLDAWEISGSATYTISEGADLSYKLGYLSPSYDGRLNSAGISDDGYFGHYLRLLISF